MATPCDDASGDGHDVMTSPGSGEDAVSQVLSNIGSLMSLLEGNSDLTVDKDRSDYVPTPALEEADQILQNTGRVILCGPPGSGKTTLAYALTRRCRKQGFCVYTLEQIERLRSQVGKRERSIVLLDGNFGKMFLDSQQHGYWNMVLDTILQLLRVGTCRLVITAYPHVLRELQLLENKWESPLLDDNAIVRLADPLPEQVKISLVTFHLKALSLGADRQHDVVQEVLKKDVSGPVFPWCCEYMVKHWNSSGDPTAIFTVPAEAHVQLLKEMVVNKPHGRIFAAVLALTMKGVFNFLHHLSEAEPHLEMLGFPKIDDDTLATFADILQGSVLWEGGFSSRVVYEAAGLALGRYFRLPTLLRVCDVPFLVKYVTATAADQEVSGDDPVKLCVSVGSVASCFMDPKRCEDDCRALVERIYTEIVQGHLQDICQHPCLQCPQFLQELDRFCSQDGRRMDRLLKAVDPEHQLPLVYWSAFHPSPNLTRWCLSKTQGGKPKRGLVLIVCSLLDHMTRSSGCRLPSAIQEGLSHEDFEHSDLVMAFPLPGKDHHLTEGVQQQIELITGTGIAQERLLYLGDPSLPITPDIVLLLVTRQKLGLKVADRRQWYLVFRLLSDRQMGQTDKDGNSLLHLAVIRGDLTAVTMCLRSGATITQPNKNGLTPYHLAHSTRSLEPKTRPAIDPLNRLFWWGTKIELQLLLLQELSVHHKDKKGWTGLLLACHEGWEDVAALYIQLGADVNVVASKPYRDVFRLTLKYARFRKSIPLHLACWKGTEGTVGLLLQNQADVTATTDTGDTALHIALLASSPTASANITRALVQAGADVNAQNKWGGTPLLCAASNGYSCTVELLVHHGADVNLRNKLGNTPLLLAIFEGHQGTAELLVHCGADVNTGNKGGDTPLLYAAKYGHPDTAEMLIRHGADVNIQDDEGSTPLTWAVMCCRPSTVKLLLQHGANVNTQNKHGSTPLLLAERHPHYDIRRLLECHQPRAPPLPKWIEL